MHAPASPWLDEWPGLVAKLRYQAFFLTGFRKILRGLGFMVKADIREMPVEDECIPSDMIGRDIPNCWQKLLFQGQLQYGLCPH
ncbi:hypothetical protein GCM10011363_45210 [Marivita lacus]|uniref:Transposase DDE domain-containing protein n=1 Tax=Marivita lacus TaxID=1323742 RepID=A0ABQ1LEU9_9RHOB|nr:hypothetical protein GCM10011363_45210 [Marivita lacus]